MPLVIRVLDPRDDTQLRRFHEINRRAEKEDGRDWTIVASLDELTQTFREPDPEARIEGYCAYDGDTMVGVAVLEVFLLENLDKVWAQVFVEPECRRQGIGSALVEHIVERARAEKRVQVTGEATYAFDERDVGPTVRFAEKHGFQIGNMEIQRNLRLPVPDDLLDAIAAESALRHAGYSLETYVDGPPAPLDASYCALHNLLPVEAPEGEFDWDEESMTPELLADRVRKMQAVGQVRYTTVAVHEGEVVALTDLVVPRDEPTVIQWATLVARGHRGHRLGAAVKVANLRALQAAHPERTTVATQNAETNDFMVSINDRLGFVAVAACPGFLRNL